MSLVDPPDHVFHVLGKLLHDPVLLEERLDKGGGAPLLLPDLYDLLQPPLAKTDEKQLSEKVGAKDTYLLYLASPGPHVLAVDAVQVSQVAEGVIDILGNKLDLQSIGTSPGLQPFFWQPLLNGFSIRIQ